MSHWQEQVGRWTEKIKRIMEDEKKRVNVLLGLGMSGLLLLAFSEWMPSERETVQENVMRGQEQTDASYAEQLETRLQEVLSEMDGVGTVRVMVTLECGEENVYATDRQEDADGAASENHVLLGDSGLLETTQEPKVLGVAVVCEGGGDISVQNQVSALVKSLTGAGTNHITVAKMAATE